MSSPQLTLTETPAQILRALERNPQGVDVPMLTEWTGLSEDALLKAVSTAIEQGRLERWPFWPDRVRATRSELSPYLREIARLRDHAWPELVKVNAVSRWPTTLHLLVPGAHAVLERFPWQGAESDLNRERAAYATPRALKSGATAMALIASLSTSVRASICQATQILIPEDFFAEIRERGYCLMRGNDVKGGWILSAPLCADHETPYGALCTFGFAEDLPSHIAEKATKEIARSARRLSTAFQSPQLARRARALIQSIVTERGIS